MIEVEYLGRLGNNLFQYCFGRIAALQLHWALKVSPLAGFPRTRELISGNSYDSPIDEVTDDNCDRSALMDGRPRRIRLKGFFQRHEFYRPYRAEICDWLTLESPAPAKAPDDAIVVNVRRTDYIDQRWALPYSYYRDAIRQSGASHVIIVTDDPLDPFFWMFREFSPQFMCADGLSALAFLVSARRLVMSQSSFSWWASFLGNMDEVFAPLPAFGIWTWDHVNLIERDRFRCIRCGEYEPTRLVAQYRKLVLLYQKAIVHFPHLRIAAAGINAAIIRYSRRM